MLINNKDLKLILKAELLRSKMLPKSIAINKYKQITLSKEYQDNVLELDFYIKSSSYNETYELGSKLIKELVECIIKLDNLKNFKGTLLSHNLEKFIRLEKQILKVVLIGDCYDDELTVIANRILSKSITLSSNLDTPAIVEITPSINLIDLVVTGLGESFTIKNLTAGQKVIINGEDGTVLQGTTNKFADWDGWEFPRLAPGANTITFSKSSCDISIKYKPRWI